MATQRHFAAALLLFGAARMPYEAALAKELRAARLTPQPLEIGTREKIGQTSSAVALGGLRTLVATFLSLRAYSFLRINVGTTSPKPSIPSSI
ncbi:MAG: hypothetical protein HC845_00580 [Akkermansiaceae bacterium]|nr:hypothetical protein [Akkermansiaceae bacterium]